MQTAQKGGGVVHPSPTHPEAGSAPITRTLRRQKRIASVVRLAIAGNRREDRSNSQNLRKLVKLIPNAEPRPDRKEEQGHPKFEPQLRSFNQ
jgi:hypothetical protein